MCFVICEEGDTLGCSLDNVVLFSFLWPRNFLFRLGCTILLFNMVGLFFPYYYWIMTFGFVDIKSMVWTFDIISLVCQIIINYTYVYILILYCFRYTPMSC